jgi:glycosyltransferase involved in cell wall biosynthesis
MGETAATSENRRILMVAPQPIFEPRGTPFSVTYRIRALCRLGYEVDLITYPYGRDPKIEGLRTTRVPRLPGISGVPIGPSLAKVLLDELLAIWLAAFLVRRRYLCIWSHEEAGFFCGIASRLTKTPHIYDMHSDLCQQIKNFKPYRIKPIVWLFDKIERAIIHTADVVLTICDDLVDRVRSIDPERPVLLVENYSTAVDFLDDEVPTLEELRNLHLADGRSVALYIGSLEPYQGIEILLGAASYLDDRNADCRLLIVGGRGEQVDALRKEVRNRKLERIVHVVGTVPPAVVGAYIELSDILLTARSRGTNVPLKLYSYMKSGRPILATNIYSHTQLLDHKMALLVDPEPTAFGRGIEQLIDNPEMRERLVAAATERSKAFSDEVFEQNIQKAVQMATENMRAGSPCAAS